MVPKSWRGAAVVAAALLVVSACASASSQAGGASASGAGTPKQGGTLRVARAESFDGWDPDKAAAYASYQTLQGVLEPMVRFAADGKRLEPGIAESWTYDPKGPSWTFVLRPGVTFSDGEPLTAQDVAFSAGVWAKGKNFGVLYAGIKKVRAVDERTVTFDLAGADTSLPVLMTWSSSAIYPKDFGGRTQDAYFAKPVGAGAFTVAEWTPGGRIVLKRSEHYYVPGRPFLDEVDIDVVADANERAILFQSGQVDVSEYVSAIDAPQYGDSLVTLPRSQVEHLSLNTTRPILADRDVRLAIAHAIDYAAIAGGPFRGHASAPQGILPPNLANWAPPTLPPFSEDLDKARSLLAGSAHARPGELELVYDSGQPVDHLIAQVLKENLARIGVEVKLSGSETGAFLDRAYGLDADMVLWSYGAVSPDEVDPLGWISGTSWLFTGLDTATLAEQFGAYSAAESPTAKQKIITQVQDEALRNAQAISLCEFEVLHGVSATVEGFASAPWGMYYWDPIWVDS
jgi:peptide/nickel transport system substrate-binding protein